MEYGEDVKECAIRETIEETGMDIRLLKDEPVYTNKYTTPSGEEVECIMYIAEKIGPYEGFIKEEDKEICEWVSVDEVYDKLTYDNIKEMWKDVKEEVLNFIN